MGSPGNHAETDFFTQTVKQWDYIIDTMPFACLDYSSGESSLEYKDCTYEVNISPFSR
jgi:aminopeptidase YwaD